MSKCPHRHKEMEANKYDKDGFTLSYKDSKKRTCNLTGGECIRDSIHCPRKFEENNNVKNRK